MTRFMEPSDIQPGDTVFVRGLHSRHLTMRVVSVTCGFATCRWAHVTHASQSHSYIIIKFNIFHTSDLVVVARGEFIRHE